MMRRELLLVSLLAAIGCGGESAPTDASAPDGASADAGMDAASACRDDDGDGYGVGCALGPDCDDSDAARSPASAV